MPYFFCRNIQERLYFWSDKMLNFIKRLVMGGSKSSPTVEVSPDSLPKPSAPPLTEAERLAALGYGDLPPTDAEQAAALGYGNLPPTEAEKAAALGYGGMPPRETNITQGEYQKTIETRPAKQQDLSENEELLKRMAGKPWTFSPSFMSKTASPNKSDLNSSMHRVFDAIQEKIFEPFKSQQTGTYSYKIGSNEEAQYDSANHVLTIINMDLKELTSKISKAANANEKQNIVKQYFDNFPKEGSFAKMISPSPHLDAMINFVQENKANFVQDFKNSIDSQSRVSPVLSSFKQDTGPMVPPPPARAPKNMVSKDSDYGGEKETPTTVDVTRQKPK